MEHEQKKTAYERTVHRGRDRSKLQDAPPSERVVSLQGSSRRIEVETSNALPLVETRRILYVTIKEDNMRYKLIVNDTDCSIAYETDKADELIKQLESLKRDEPKEEKPYTRPLTPYERCRNAVYATGNRWAIENFNATH